MALSDGMQALWAGWPGRLGARLTARLTAWRPEPRAAAAAPRPLPSLPAQPAEARASVVIPALTGAAHIADVVACALADPATAEVIVVDDGSSDDTAALARQAGARVVASSMLGKGACLRDGVALAAQELVVFLDGDLAGLRRGVVTELCRPLCEDRADFVKARFGSAAGCVAELAAKPMLKLFFPELAGFSQPLGGVVAARRSLLRTLAFEDGWGVDVGLLIDAQLAGARLDEVDIGSLEQQGRPPHDPAGLAGDAARIIHGRARAAGRLQAECIGAMYEAQRAAAGDIGSVFSRRRGQRRLLLLDMDGTVTTERYIDALARASGQDAGVQAVLDEGPADTAAQRAAGLFRHVHQRQFERVARELPIRQGTIAFVNRMRRLGFMVGLVSDSYFIAAEIVRRRIFADFAIAHLMQFDGEVCGGQLQAHDAFLTAQGAACKSEVLHRFRRDAGSPPLCEIWAVGDDHDDLPLLRAADRAFTIDPKTPALRREPGVVVVAELQQIAALAEAPVSVS